jgi:hypothetical protein
MTTLEREVAEQAAAWAKVRDGLPTTHQGIVDRLRDIVTERQKAENVLLRESHAKLDPLRQRCGELGHIYNDGRFLVLGDRRSCVVCGSIEPRRAI